jgi:hypothetical protein
MKRPFAEKRPIGPFSDVIGSRSTGSSPADEFEGMFESFTIVLEYNLKSSTLITDDDLGEEGFRLEDVLNEYLFTGDYDPLYFMRAESSSGGAYSGRLLFGIDGDIWEGRLNREGKFEGSIAGTENVLNANLQLDAAVANSYMSIYPTQKAKEIQETGSIDMG